MFRRVVSIRRQNEEDAQARYLSLSRSPGAGASS